MTFLVDAESKRDYIKDKYELEDLLQRLINDSLITYDDVLDLIVEELDLWNELLFNGDSYDKEPI